MVVRVLDSPGVELMPDAKVATTEMVAVEPPGPRGKKVGLPLVTGLTRGDGRARLDRVDVRLDVASKRPVGRRGPIAIAASWCMRNRRKACR